MQTRGHVRARATRHLRVSFALLAAGVTVSSLARADVPSGAAHDATSNDAPDAAEIKQRGDEAMDSGRPADALAAYVQAYDLTHDPALLYNKGRALEALTQYPQALEELQAFDRVAPADLKQRVPGLARMIDGLRARVTTVSIACDVAGARLRLRDRTIGACPLAAPITVNAGKATLEATADGYFPFTKEVDLPGGGVASLEVHLVSKTTTGILVVRASVPGASVAIDGAPSGTSPVESTLKAGSHRLDVRRDGYKPLTTTAVVTAGERREVDLSLEKEPGLLGRWWFWAGVGAVVAGGVVLVVAATTERSPDKGTVPPHVVVGGLSGAGFRF
jgi:hypothetical protein